MQNYNQLRIHESLDNLTPADVYHGSTALIAKSRDLDKEQPKSNRGCMKMGLEPLGNEPVKPAILRESVW